LITTPTELFAKAVNNALLRGEVKHLVPHKTAIGNKKGFFTYEHKLLSNIFIDSHINHLYYQMPQQ